MRRRGWIVAAWIIAAAAALAYLRDPPWAGAVTSGLRPWEQDPPGTFFRWTAGRATFFVPSSASAMTLPLRAVFPGPNGAPVRVEIREDGALLGTIDLGEPDAWVTPTLTLKPMPGGRRFRRIDLSISRVVPPFTLGVMTGQVTLR
jgi:hypothetical protein